MSTLTTAIAVGTTALLAVPILALAAPTGSPTCSSTVTDTSGRPAFVTDGTERPDGHFPASARLSCVGSQRAPGGAGPPSGAFNALGTSAQARLAVAWALAQLGTPYSYGGDCTAPRSGDPRRECDCSSLVQMAYRNAGVMLPRTTFEQVAAGAPVPSLADLQPGDLVFIPGADGSAVSPGHVGLMVGADLLIQAPSTGRAVRLTSLNEWRGAITQVRRVTLSNFAD